MFKYRQTAYSTWSEWPSICHSSRGHRQCHPSMDFESETWKVGYTYLQTKSVMLKVGQSYWWWHI